MSEFRAALRRRRKEAGLSLADFSRRTNFSPGYLSKIENGRSRASRHIAEVCDRALDAGGDLLLLVPDDGDSQPIAALPDLGPVLLGRGVELEHLSAALQNPRGPAALVIAGLAGIGKTALAVAAARRSAAAFPGGLFFVDLGPPEQPAPTAAETLDRALRALGVPGRQIPEHTSGRTALLRERVQGRPALLVADNAASAAQLRPLMAAGRDCRLLVTSRRRLTALDEAEHLVLGPLPGQAARALFRRISGSAGGRAPEAPRPPGTRPRRRPAATAAEPVPPTTPTTRRTTWSPRWWTDAPSSRWPSGSSPPGSGTAAGPPPNCSTGSATTRPAWPP